MTAIGDKRDLADLRRNARLLTQDLARNIGPTWACDVTDAYEVIVTSGDRRAAIAIEPEISEDYFWDAFNPGTDDLDNDAAEAVGDALLDALEHLEVDWPRCPQHQDARLSVCSGLWTCGGKDPHDAEVIGELHSPLAT